MSVYHKIDLLPFFAHFDLRHVLREITKACGRSVAALKASVGILPSQLHSLSKSPSLQFSQSSVVSVFSCLSLLLPQSSAHQFPAERSVANGPAPQPSHLPTGRH